MANIYVRSTDGSDADNGSTWALAKATIAGALAIAVAGDTIWVSQNHAETSSASDITLTLPNAPSNPVMILCGNDAAQPPTSLAASATVTTTSTRSILINGYGYVYGITFRSGNGSSSNSNSFSIATSTSTGHGLIFDGCGFSLLTTGSSATFTIGTGSTAADDLSVEFLNCAFRLGNVGHKMTFANRVRFDDLCFFFLVGSVPTVAFQPSSGIGGVYVTFANSDMSFLGSGKTVLDLTRAVRASFDFIGCSLGAGVALTTGTPTGIGGIQARFVNCDSGDTNYKYHLENYLGTIDDETTIVRSGGASDGVNSISRKMASSANTRWFSPLTTDPIVVWNDTTGSSKTITIEVVSDGVTFTDAELWAELEYPSNASFSFYSIARDRSASIIASGSNQDSSTETWTTTGLSSPVKQKLVVTFTPQNKGPLYVRVCLAKPSSTVYVDPLATVA